MFCTVITESWISGTRSLKPTLSAEPTVSGLAGNERSAGIDATFFFRTA